MGRLIIDGNSVYEVDEECLRQKEQQAKAKRQALKEQEGEGLKEKQGI